MTTVDTGTCQPRKSWRGEPFERQTEVAQAFKALGDPTRLAILQMIVEAQELCACEIEPSFKLSQPTISHHLKLLREAGLIIGERRGTWIHYRADRRVIAGLLEHPIFRKWWVRA